MQSTVRSAAPPENGLTESLHSQAETSGRMPFLAGHLLMQQSRRMKQRPFAIAGVRVADSNRFIVNLDSQAETSNRPLIFDEPLHQQVASPALTEVSNLKALSTASSANVWDFRAFSAAATETSFERSYDWPALDEEQYKIPTPAQATKVWSMATSMSRIPAQTIRAKKAAADAETLRQLLDETLEREAQRITARMQAFSPEKESNQSEKVVILLDAAKAICGQIKTQCRLLSSFAEHLLNTVANHKSSTFAKQHE